MTKVLCSTYGSEEQVVVLAFPSGVPVSVLVLWMHIRDWQIHTALFGNLSGTELKKSESDSKLMEPEWQLDANPVLLDPFMHFVFRDSSI